MTYKTRVERVTVHPVNEGEDAKELTVIDPALEPNQQARLIEVLPHIDPKTIYTEGEGDSRVTVVNLSANPEHLPRDLDFDVVEAIGTHIKGFPT